MSKRLRPYLDYLAELGCEVVDHHSTGSCHYKITVTSEGKRRFFIAPYSASDRRSFENWKSDVRKWLRQNNAETEENRAGAGSKSHNVARWPSTTAPR